TRKFRREGGRGLGQARPARWRRGDRVAAQANHRPRRPTRRALLHSRSAVRPITLLARTEEVIEIGGHPQYCCCGVRVRFWHSCDMARLRIEFRFPWKSGHAADITAISRADMRGWAFN